MEHTYKNLYRLGVVAYAVLFIFALVFYKERTVFVDIAFHLFCILKDGHFAIQNFRYGAVVTQVFPLLASKLSLPLNIVAVIYSSAFIAYYFLCYILCGSVLKQYRMALVMLLFNILFVTDTFYWIQSELPQGIALLVVVFAYLTTRDSLEIQMPALMVLLFSFTVLHFFHPLLFIAVFYTFGFFILNNKTELNRKLLLLCAVWFIIVWIVKVKFMPVAAYDSQRMDIADKFKELIDRHFSNRATEKFALACLYKFCWIPISIFLIVRHYLKERQYKMLWFFFVSFIGYLLLVNISYPQVWVPAFYMENFYLILAVIIAVPFVYDVLPSFQKPNTAVFIMSAILLTAIVRIYGTHLKYTDRLNWQRKLLSENLNKKLVIKEDKTIEKKLLMTWGTPYEFWLLSTIENGHTASILITDHLDDFSAPVMWKNKAMITTYGTYDYADMPARYFKFTDTVSKYTIIK